MGQRVAVEILIYLSECVRAEEGEWTWAYVCWVIYDWDEDIGAGECLIKGTRVKYDPGWMGMIFSFLPRNLF